MNVSEIRIKIEDAEFKINAYAKTYIQGLDEANAFYGAKGVKAQCVYIATNLRAKGDVQKKVKKELLAYGNS